MKKLFLSTAIAFSAIFTYAQQNKVDNIAKFENETIDLGTVKQGNPATAKFTVTNIGSEPLIIEQANPTCGCTVSDYTKEPIAAGKTGYINATYNAANAGHFDKHLTVKFAGVDEMKTITISGEVKSGDEVSNVTTEPKTVEPAQQPVAPTNKTIVKKKKPVRKSA